jgi:opine dehydrogenase
MMKITVLGGGHGCYAAAEMAEKGHEVLLWRRDSDALQQLAATGQLKIKDYQGDRTVTVGFEKSQINLSDDLQRAIDMLS